jgi:hypothetical protein
VFVLIIADRVVLLVVEADAGGVGRAAAVLHGVDEDFALVDNDLVGLGGVILVLEVELVGGEGLNRQVGGQNGPVLCN